MVIGVAGFAPRPIAFTNRALMDIATIANAQRRDIRIAAQQILTAVSPRCSDVAASWHPRIGAVIIVRWRQLVHQFNQSRVCFWPERPLIDRKRLCDAAE